MHRFLPPLVLRAGGDVRSEPVNHRPRRSGVSKYGVFDRLGVGIFDLFGVLWLQRRALQQDVIGEVKLLPSPRNGRAGPAPVSIA